MAFRPPGSQRNGPDGVLILPAIPGLLKCAPQILRCIDQW